MKYLALLPCLLSIICCAQLPTNPAPYSIKSDTLGESTDTFISNNQACRTHDWGRDSGVTVCEINGGTYADVEVSSKRAYFFKGHLYQLWIKFPHADYADLATALTSKYGTESNRHYVDGSTMLTVVQIEARREFSFEERREIPSGGANLTWNNGVSSIQLDEYELSDISFRSASVTFFVDSVLNEVKAMPRTANNHAADM